MSQKVAGLPGHLGRVQDPRMDRPTRHWLIDVLVIAIWAVICGADDWVAVAAFGRAKQKGFKTVLRLPNGMPSHDTLGRVLARLDPHPFQQAMQSPYCCCGALHLMPQWCRLLAQGCAIWRHSGW